MTTQLVGPFAVLCVGFGECKPWPSPPRDNRVLLRSSAQPRRSEKAAWMQPLALVAGQPIYERDLDRAIASQVLPLRNQEYQIKSKALEDLIRQRLVEAEATKQGITIDQLYAKEVDSKIPTPSEGEVAVYYLALKSQIKTPFQEVKAQLQTSLKALETRQARQDYADSLRTKADVAVLLQQPRVEVGLTALKCMVTSTQRLPSWSSRIISVPTASKPKRRWTRCLRSIQGR